MDSVIGWWVRGGERFLDLFVQLLLRVRAVRGSGLLGGSGLVAAFLFGSSRVEGISAHRVLLRIGRSFSLH
ncbi:hypothetical protein ACFFX0_27115 [Citricoccus parietis]|uniref:Uncharacterized protein n=1 Tax=Citricoccus parietis TaxID=592307 RepID=A0ABV5G6T7_9MICC